MASLLHETNCFYFININFSNPVTTTTPKLIVPLSSVGSNNISVLYLLAKALKYCILLLLFLVESVVDNPFTWVAFLVRDSPLDFLPLLPSIFVGYAYVRIMAKLGVEQMHVLLLLLTELIMIIKCVMYTVNGLHYCDVHKSKEDTSLRLNSPLNLSCPYS